VSKRQTTANVAALLRVNEHTLRMWVHRGHLKLTPVSRGRNAPWSEEAIAEAKAWAEQPRRGRRRESEA
jgi:predicted site-specific integrase-resolvase